MTLMESRRRFDVQPGDVLRSLHGRTRRRVICVDEGDVILRTTKGGVECVSLEDVCAHWYKVNADEFRRSDKS